MDELLDLPELFDAIQELLDMGMYDEALKMLDYHTPFYPEEAEIQFLYARIYLEQNNPTVAIPFLHNSLRLEKNNVDCLLGLFYAYAQLGKLTKGAKYLFKAEKYHSANELVQSALIWYYTETNEPDKAITAFSKAQDLGTDNPDTFRNAGIALERCGQYEKAQQCFLNALMINPGYDDVRDLLADLYMLTEQTDKAIDLYQEYLKTSPKNIRALSRLTFCFSQCDKTAEALALAQETIRLYPNSPVGYVDCSYAYLDADDIDNSIYYAEKALDVSPIDAEALHVKAIAYAERNSTTEAKQAFEAALTAEPHNPEIMRDYYTFLKDAGEFKHMEQMVSRVIKQEYPYCIDDYWFLADYYRTKKDNLKAFHYLHKAYTGMPGNKDVIPPMIDIMLETGHMSLTGSLMLRYVERSGWNSTMEQVARHKKLKNRRAQEGLRFLRFYSQNKAKFRNYLFVRYLNNYLVWASCLVIPPVIYFLYLVCGAAYAVLTAMLVLLLWGTWITVQILATKKSKEPVQP
jgi:tetratricopeptide (TPR) repeat protein